MARTSVAGRGTRPNTAAKGREGSASVSATTTMVLVSNSVPGWLRDLGVEARAGSITSAADLEAALRVGVRSTEAPEDLAARTDLGGAISRFRAENPGIRVEVEADTLEQVRLLTNLETEREKLLQIDIDNVKAAAKAAGVPENHVFLPATAPSGVGINEYYKSDEEYFQALAVELNKEYRAIVAAGLLVQVDDPFLPDIFFEPGLDDAQKKRRAQIYVDAINRALEGIPADMVRFHTCYGINEGPRLYEAALSDIIEYMLKINAGSYSFEGANPRHEHEYHLFEKVKVPDGKVLCPGVISPGQLGPMRRAPCSLTYG